jgi:hypothetical protein
MPSTKTKTKTKNFIKKGRGGSGEFINIFEEYPGYYSVNILHKKNSSNKEILEEENELLKPIISQLLTSGDYHVPSYLTSLTNERDEEDTTTDEDEDEDDDEEKLMPIQKENIIITITPVEKYNDNNKVIEEELYNALVDSAEGLEMKKLTKAITPHPKKMTRRKKVVKKVGKNKKTKKN